MSTSEPMTPDAPPRWLLPAVVLVMGLSMLATVLSPYLLRDDPLLLLALNPDSKFLLLSGAGLDDGAVLFVVALRRALNLLLVFLVARFYAGAVTRRLEDASPRARRMMAWLRGPYARYGAWLVLAVPLLPTVVLAGLARMPRRTFVLAMVPGQLAITAALLAFGASIEAWTAPVVDAFADNALAATAVLAVAMTLRLRKTRLAPTRVDHRESPPRS